MTCWTGGERHAGEAIIEDDYQGDKPEEAVTYLDIALKSCDETVNAALLHIEVVQADAHFHFLIFLNVVDIVPSEQITKQKQQSK